MCNRVCTIDRVSSFWLHGDERQVYHKMSHKAESDVASRSEATDVVKHYETFEQNMEQDMEQSMELSGQRSNEIQPFVNRVLFTRQEQLALNRVQFDRQQEKSDSTNQTIDLLHLMLEDKIMDVSYLKVLVKQKDKMIEDLRLSVIQLQCDLEEQQIAYDKERTVARRARRVLANDLQRFRNQSVKRLRYLRTIDRAIQDESLVLSEGKTCSFAYIGACRLSRITNYWVKCVLSVYGTREYIKAVLQSLYNPNGVINKNFADLLESEDYRLDKEHLHDPKRSNHLTTLTMPDYDEDFNADEHKRVILDSFRSTLLLTTMSIMSPKRADVSNACGSSYHNDFFDITDINSSRAIPFKYHVYLGNDLHIYVCSDDYSDDVEKAFDQFHLYCEQLFVDECLERRMQLLNKFLTTD